LATRTVFITGATGYLGSALVPGHLRPWALVPFFALLELIPATRDGARRLGLVTRGKMLRALAAAVENPPSGVRIVDVAGVRAA
jgi:uncharacterized protein YbjT (DUF2867 family)